MQGKLITFEGVDLSGKSLQAKLLNEKLLSKGIATTFLREPGSTDISEKIRDLLLDNENHKMVKEAEVLLYSAARTQMVSEQIIPALKKGQLVICDRFFDSTTAYQGYGREIDLEFIHKLNNFVTHAIRPDLTVLIDVPPQVALARKREKGEVFDRLEQESMSFHEKVRNAYLEIATSTTEKSRFAVIAGDRPVEQIQKEVYSCVRSRLGI